MTIVRVNKSGDMSPVSESDSFEIHSGDKYMVVLITVPDDMDSLACLLHVVKRLTDAKVEFTIWSTETKEPKRIW